MKKNIKILDCTLRDGGRVIECRFPDFHLDGIVNGLSQSGIDIVEIGFLRGDMDYRGGTFFTELTQIEKHIPAQHETMYVAFVDYGKQYGMWDFSKLPVCDNTGITGIRLGFRKEDFQDAFPTMRLIQEKGYKLFVQPVETLSYSDKELVEMLECINVLHPYSMGIVDTFGSMYKEDLLRVYTLLDHNLDDNIYIDLHSHNNLQLSFAFAQEIVELSRKNRGIILDATLNGLGKGAGNLNTELIVDFLNRKYNYAYDLDLIFDTIDEHISWIRQEHEWGYSIPRFMSGIYSAHPNNILYLSKAHWLKTKDIKYILSMIDPSLRKRYDYDNIERLYIEYSNTKHDDAISLATLRKTIAERDTLVIVFGHTATQYKEKIAEYIKEANPVVISVNHLYDLSTPDFVFYGNQRRYSSKPEIVSPTQIIATSNIHDLQEDCLVVNYNRLISRDCKSFDNSTGMLLTLLHLLNAKSIHIVGFDGYDADGMNFSSVRYANNFEARDYHENNENIRELLKRFASRLDDKSYVRFLTTSRFEDIFQ